MSVKQTIQNLGTQARQSEAVHWIARRPSRRAVAVAGIALAVVSVPWLTGAHAETVELAAQSAVIASDSAPQEAAMKARAKKASARKGADRETSDKGKSKKVQAQRTVVQAAARKRAPAAPAQPRQRTTSASGSDSSSSWYQGSYYSPGYESLRRCIVHRESRGNYQARNPSSGASGAYQFLLSTSNEVARMMSRPDLVGSPAATWSHYEQDAAFWTLFDHGRGISHWGGRCG